MDERSGVLLSYTPKIIKDHKTPRREKMKYLVSDPTLQVYFAEELPVVQNRVEFPLAVPMEFPADVVVENQVVVLPVVLREDFPVVLHVVVSGCY